MWGSERPAFFRLFCQLSLRARSSLVYWPKAFFHRSLGQRPSLCGRGRVLSIGRRPFFTVAWGNAPGMDVRSDAFGRRPCSSYTSIPDVLLVIPDVVAFEKLAVLLLKRLHSVMFFLIANILFCICQMGWAHGEHAVATLPVEVTVLGT